MSFNEFHTRTTSISDNMNLLSEKINLKHTLGYRESEEKFIQSHSGNFSELKVLKEKIKREDKLIKIEQIMVLILIILYFIFIGYMLL